MKKHSITPKEILHNCSSPLLVHGVVVPCGKCYWCLSRIRREAYVLRKPSNEPCDDNLVVRMPPKYPVLAR